MADTPEEVFEKTKAEELAKGADPRVAEARAKAARARAKKASESASEPAPSPSPAATVGRAEPAGNGDVGMGDTGNGDIGQVAPAPVAVSAAAAVAPASGGRGARAKAARAASGGTDVPERVQRLLAVVKPEAIQRVEREPMDRVNVWPHLIAAEFLSLLVMTVFLLLFSTFVNAPLRELANLNQTPNPSKAPWYFLGLQELLRYFHPQVAGVTIPQWIILGWMATPYMDRNPSTRPEQRKLAIVMFTIYILFFSVLVILGSFFRGPGFNFVYPWESGIFFEL